MTEAEQTIDIYLNKIIDETHPLFKAISDEELIENHETYGIYERSFLHKTGKKFKMRWRVLYGTPETVKTVFEPAVVL